MIQRLTKTFDRIYENRHNRTQILQGGTSSSKTYSILQYLYLLALESDKKFVFSIVAETGPHLKRGAMRDFFNIVGDSYREKDHNKSDWQYYVGPGKSVFEFFSADNPAKLRGGRRDFLFINECNNVRKSSRDQLEVRTKYREFLDFNPVQHFWGHELIARPKTSFDISTYRDNQYLDKRIIASIEARRGLDPNWWRVYGEGQVGKLEGLILPDFELIDEMPDIPVTLGLDFGFTNDPSALVQMGVDGRTIYLDELFYEYGLTNPAIADKMEKLGVPQTQLIYADSAEPKSIQEIRNKGYLIKPCVKGKDRIHAEIDYLRSHKVKITKKSTNLIKELRGWTYIIDDDEKITNTPAEVVDHAIDGVRYSLTGKIKPSSTASGGRVAM